MARINAKVLSKYNWLFMRKNWTTISCEQSWCSQVVALSDTYFKYALSYYILKFVDRLKLSASENEYLHASEMSGPASDNISGWTLYTGLISAKYH